VSLCRSLPVAVALGVFGLTATRAVWQEQWNPESIRVVAAIRYLQIEGVSHAHVYLFCGDGKLLRQLTRDNSGNDFDPVFSSDGKRIVFRRQKKSGSRFFQVELANDRVTSLDRAPSWYDAAVRERTADFDAPPSLPLPHDSQQQRIADYIKPGDVVYAAPDNSTAIILKDKPSEAKPEDDWYPKDVYLRKGTADSDVLISKLPFVSLEAASAPAENAMRTTPNLGFHLQTGDEVGDVDGVLVCNGSPFLWIGRLHIAFLRQHRGSTFCEGYFAVDVDQTRVHEVAPTCGDIIPIPNKPAFFCICDERYLPLGDGKRTVNCSFLDLWTADLKRVRFSEPKVAVYYGGSMFQPGGAPTVLVLRERIDP
jgi:hypothetical protein